MHEVVDVFDFKKGNEQREKSLFHSKNNLKVQDKSPNEISAPFPPIPAMKHSNPHDTSSATTSSTTFPESTVSHS